MHTSISTVVYQLLKLASGLAKVVVSEIFGGFAVIICKRQKDVSNPKPKLSTAVNYLNLYATYECNLILCHCIHAWIMSVKSVHYFQFTLLITFVACASQTCLLNCISVQRTIVGTVGHC